MRRLPLLIISALALIMTGANPPAPRVAEERVILHTDAGDLLLALYPDIAPRHVEQFLKLVRLGVYDTTHFCRVEPGFVVQLSTAEDRVIPLNADQRSNIRAIPAEFSAIAHTAGTLSMARHPSDPDSAETSFSILLANAPHLDGKFTVFGHVEAGIEALQEILRVPRRTNHSPVVRINVTSAEVVEGNSPPPALASPRAITIDRGLLWRELGSLDPLSPDPATSPWRLLPQTDPILLAGLAAATVGSLAIYVSAFRVPSRVVTSIALVNALIAGFVMFAVLAPVAETSHAVAVFVFLGWLGLIRLMGRFECAV